MIKSLYITKLNNLMTISGRKHKSEGVVLQSFKKLQKKSIKQAYVLLQTTIKHLTPVFRLQSLTSKKKRKKSGQIKKKTSFILNPLYRLTLAIKYVQEAVKSQKIAKASEALTKEIILTCELNSTIFQKKQEYQKQVLLYKKFNKKIRRNYRWKN
jgi:ribosomal protein S7